MAQEKDGVGTRERRKAEHPRQYPPMLEGVQRCSAQKCEWKQTRDHGKHSSPPDGTDGQLSQGWQEAAE